MIRKMQKELKIAGINFFLVAGVLAAALILLSLAAGELIDFYPVSFEVIFPFFTAVAVGEWGKTRADDNFEVIAAQGSSLFQWAALRYAAIFSMSGVFAVLCMAVSSVTRYELPLWELLVMYVSPAFFLSSLGALVGILCSQEHVGTLVCGILWLAFLLTRGLLRVPGVEYIYLFIRYAGDENHIWLWNKGILAGAGLVCWGVIYRVCKR